MPVSSSNAPFQDQLDAMALSIASKADASAMPKPASSAPPPVAVNSAVGAATGYALGDHTHQSRLQARRIQVTPDANGRYVYVFPLSYSSGENPVVQVTAETPSGAAYKNDAGIVENSTTTTQTIIQFTRLNQNVVTGLLNAVLPVFSNITTPVWVNIFSRATS